MPDDVWATLADAFVDGAYATVKGQVRTYVMHHQLLRHLAAPPASILDVGGGAGHQSLPLARVGYDVMLVDSSDAMLGKAAQRLASETNDVRSRVRLLQGDGRDAEQLTGGAHFDGVLCHGVLMYLDRPEPLVASLCERVAPGGIVSLLALNAATMAVRPALEGRWAAALAAFDAKREVGVLGAETRADTVAELSDLLRRFGVEPADWYGVWLFSDWLDLPLETTDVAAVADVELKASERDPYRQLSRVFHLLGRKPGTPRHRSVTGR